MKKKETQLYIFIKKGKIWQIWYIDNYFQYLHKIQTSNCFPFLYAQCKLFDVQTFIFLSKISNENITEINETVFYIWSEIWFEHFKKKKEEAHRYTFHVLDY